MKRQITKEQALKLHMLGVDVKMLVPNTKTSDWKDMFPTTLNDILDGAEFYADDWYLDLLIEAKQKEPEPESQPEPDDELPAELKMKLPVKLPEEPKKVPVEIIEEPKKPVRKVGQTIELDEGRIIALRTAKPPRSYKWIAEDMGVSEATIFNRCKKLAEEGRL